MAFRVVEHAWIPMADGVRLSARLWIPEGAGSAPAVLEMIPYRKRDGYRFHDDLWGPVLAEAGFAYARVDVRGTGDSEGVLTDEYLPLERQDGCACIAWLAAQSWCSGAVGMRGLSWGGINTLQVAALGPPALKAIMPMGCLDNRYTDDAHYIGGALGRTQFQWGTAFKAVMAAPPDPEIVGEAWESMWRERLEATPPILSRWLSHQRYDAYWRSGSACEDWAAIRVPTYVVSGWQDTYANPVGRLMSHLRVPRKALIGPWGHTYPYLAQPVGLDWAHEEVRWWTQWLKGVETGIMAEPAVRVFMPYATVAETGGGEVPGRWIAEASWPSGADPTILYLNDGSLSPAPGDAGAVTIRPGDVVGLTKPEWLDRPPTEQSRDDARSCVFETPPLPDDLEIFGAPALSVRVASDRPVAHIAARLSEVTGEGAWLVTWGLLNLTHRGGHVRPQALAPGEPVAVTLSLQAIAHRFRAGARIRLSLSESLWPLVWPSPEPATLTLGLGPGASLALPVRPVETAASPFPIPEVRSPPPPPATPLSVTEDEGVVRIVLEEPPKPRRLANPDVTLSRGRWESAERTPGDPGRWTHRIESRWRRGAWDCGVTAESTLTSDPDAFIVSESLVARRGERVVFRRRSRRRIRRDLV